MSLSRLSDIQGVHVHSAGKYGLANRIRGLAAHFALSQFLNVPFSYSWDESASCPGDFEEFFCASLTRCSLDDVKERSGWLVVSRGAEPTSCGNHAWQVFEAYNVAETRECFGNRVFEFFDHLEPSAAIKQACWSFLSQSNVALDGLLGVHVRRTDLVDHLLRKGLEPPSDEEMFRILDSQFADGGATSLFVATDNPDSERTLRKRYGSKVVSRVKMWNVERHAQSCDATIQERLTSLFDSVCDLYLLSKCFFIVGTQHSSFSTLAGDWGRVRVVRV